MEAIMDRDGRTVAWRRRDVVYDLSGRALAFVFDRNLFWRDGSHIGRVEDGLYRDPDGHVLAFEHGATGGPLLPAPQRAPVAPRPELRPPVPRFAPAPPAPMRRVSWSPQTWEALVGRRPAPPSRTVRIRG
jgi:hypothetical protein